MRLYYLDGLRGLAALGVVVYHFLTLYDFALETGKPEDAVFNWEYSFARSPLNIIVQGNLMVQIFFVLSGYVLLRAFSENSSFIGAFCRRYIRLVIPITCSCLLCWIFDFFNLCYLPSGSYHDPAMGQPIIEVLHQSFFSVLFSSPTSLWLDQVHWTMPIEFSGSLLLMIVAFASKARYISAPTLLLLFSYATIGYYQFSIICGVWLYLLEKANLLPKLSNWLLFLTFIFVTMVYATYPMSAKPHKIYEQLGLNISHCVDWSSFNPLVMGEEGKVQVIHGIAALFIVYLALTQTGLQNLLNRFRFLGKISFSLYLVHYPLLFATCGIYVYATSHHWPALGFLLTGVTFFTSSILLSWLIAVYVDKPAILFSKKVGQRLDRLADASIETKAGPVETALH